ncbi:MAG: hypothetical protein DLM67_26035 [Candidatus Nephthysia bennettiae]|nr:MAG: hypothetical protein DLM67_26035 [Candidatus Dormibacteraeota bacterium]
MSVMQETLLVVVVLVVVVSVLGYIVSVLSGPGSGRRPERRDRQRASELQHWLQQGQLPHRYETTYEAWEWIDEDAARLAQVGYQVALQRSGDWGRLTVVYRLEEGSGGPTIVIQPGSEIEFPC